MTEPLTDQQIRLKRGRARNMALGLVGVALVIYVTFIASGVIAAGGG